MTKAIGLSKGQRFGRLTVVREVKVGSHGAKTWLCKCDCGGTRTTSSGALTNGNVKSCGCMSRRAIELKKGQRFGAWTVVKAAVRGQGKQRLWLCKCDCGASNTVASYALRSGVSTSCGCRRRLEVKKGQRFNSWTVVERDLSVRGRTKWLCRCDCGTIKALRVYSSASANRNSCGCKSRVRVSVGQRFGRLTVLDEVKNADDGRHMCLCKCDCGATKHIKTSSLTMGRVTSCGCKCGKSIIVNGRRLSPKTLATLTGLSVCTIQWRIKRCQGDPTIEEILRPLKSKQRKAK